MPPFELLLPFIIATSVFAFVPGPGMFYMSIQTMARGRRAGWLSAAGFHLGAYVHIFAAAFGATILLQSLPFLFSTLKLAGAAYLVWMGVKIILDSQSWVAGPKLAPQQSARLAFKDSLTVELLNPKTALFFLAFLPQFASHEATAPIWAQIVILGACANIMFSATDVICILFSERLAVWASSSRAIARIGRRIGGSIFVAMGLHLALKSD
ncbi:MAG: LysE family translocator [Proteobacteria bacterium]|nr:LysE family translocator [Pseudomonadota bacterium]